MTKDDDPLAQVIQLRPEQDKDDEDRPLKTGPRPEKWCQHRRTELDLEARRVHCRDCEREVPAFDVIVDLTQNWERWIAGRKEAERRCKVEQGHLEDLLREERNAKSRRRTWKKQEPEAVRHLRAIVDLFGRRGYGRLPPVVAAAREFLHGDTEVQEADAS